MIEPKPNLRPLQYPKAFELYKNLSQNPWYPTEVNMGKDVKDWVESTPVVKRLIGILLRGFTLAEAIIGENWTTNIAAMIPIAELILLFQLFGYQETNHGWGYDHLEATLDIDSYEDFKSDPIAQKKIQHILDLKDTPYAQALHLAVFAGAIEGVSLYSSFGILLSFNTLNKFEGLGAIISWSAIDESVHSSVGISLFNEFVKDGTFPRPKQEDVHNAFDMVVQNEIEFVKHAFGDIDEIPSISKKEALTYIEYRANIKLEELGYEPMYAVNYDDVARIASFFDNTIEGAVSNDFFAVSKNGSNYTASVERDYTQINKNEVYKLIGA